MKIHELQAQARSSRKRVGRGISAGQGKTAGRGTKGQGSRAGFSRHAVFEGGQSPLTMRMPKLKGFRSKRPAVQVVHTNQLEQFKAGQSVGMAELATAGLIQQVNQPVKLLARGKLTKALTIDLPRVSRAAAQQVTAAGGKVVVKANQPKALRKAKT
ncbi:50S ribosomal protein L15 [Candidatus Microgenomates bacterium]|nr:50S ribosomal protein L15 [Candidatus Microgenomates bacterium]